MTPALASTLLLHLNGNDAKAHSLIVRHGAHLAIQLAPADGATSEAPASAWVVGFTPGMIDAVRQAATLVAQIEWAGARLRLRLPPSALAVWLSARMPELQAGPLPEPLVAAALEALLGEILASLDQVSAHGPAHVVNVEAGAAPLPHGWTVTARSAAPGEVCYATLEADGLGLMVLAGVLARTEPPFNALDTDALPVTVRASLGMATLDAQTVRSLRPRDVVLLDEYLVSPQGELWLALETGQGVRVRAEQSTFIVTRGWTSLMTETSISSPDDAGQTEEPLDADAIPVRLTFDLGERRLTLGELRRLQPGETFDLQRPLADGPVMIRANGALVGTGELVEIEGRIGVTLRTLGKALA